jgi:NAD(P)H-dependent nitrite reductase small subunit
LYTSCLPNAHCHQFADFVFTCFLSLNSQQQQEWYATQNVCPHKRALVLSQGIIGSKDGLPKVACPLHKKNFNLKTGECFDSDDSNMSLMTFPVKIEADAVWLHLPPTAVLDAVLGTKSVIFGADCTTAAAAQSSFMPFTSTLPGVAASKSLVTAKLEQ